MSIFRLIQIYIWIYFLNNFLFLFWWSSNIERIEHITINPFFSKNLQILEIIKESLSKSSEEIFSITENLSVPLREARENFEKEYLTTQIKKFGGNISKTAKFVGMERSALHRKLKLLGVKDLN